MLTTLAAPVGVRPLIEAPTFRSSSVADLPSVIVVRLAFDDSRQGSPRVAGPHTDTPRRSCCDLGESVIEGFFVSQNNGHFTRIVQGVGDI